MIVAAADGSSLNNPGPAGWAWYIDDDTWAAGGWPRGTNNMGELKAVLDVLRATRDADEPLTILCDSQYALTAARSGFRDGNVKDGANVTASLYSTGTSSSPLMKSSTAVTSPLSG